MIAVGDLVERTGFRHLVAAVAMFESEDPLPRLVIVGDGPLRGELQESIRRLELAERAEIRTDASGAGEVRGLLERSDVLAASSVVAADGDRDAMHMAVKEALAMEVPVVASDEVGLP